MSSSNTAPKRGASPNASDDLDDFEDEQVDHRDKRQRTSIVAFSSETLVDHNDTLRDSAQEPNNTFSESQQTIAYSDVMPTSTIADASLYPTENSIPGTQSKEPFRFIDALCSQSVDCLLEVISFLPPRAIVDLYSISSSFRSHFLSNQTQFILAATRIWAPSASTLIPWRFHQRLCVPDPAGRPSSSSPNTPRLIPSLRWLRMVVYRTMVSGSILAHLASRGHSMPPTARPALMKLWFLLDIPLSAVRISLIRNKRYFTDDDLFHLQLVFIKIDAALTDPLSFVGGESGLRKILFAETTLTTLWDTLRRPNAVKALMLMVKHIWTPGPSIRAAMIADGEATVMDIPLSLCGRGGYELWGLGIRKLMRPDELVMREGVRRRLKLEEQFVSMLRWGTYARTKEGKYIAVSSEAAVRAVEEVVPTIEWGRGRRELRKVKREGRERDGLRMLMSDEEGEWERGREEVLELIRGQEDVD